VAKGLRWLERAGGILALLAGSVHGLVAPSHFAEWWGYGLFFVVAGLAQIVLGFAMLTNAINETSWGPTWMQARRRLWLLGIVGHLLIMALYVVTRTTGIPLFGPEAGEVEAIEAIDLVSKVLETGVVVALGALWWMRVPSVERAATLR
jgi:hypothetical protein